MHLRRVQRPRAAPVSYTHLALRNGLRHPELFGGIIALSSALITDALAQQPEHQGNMMASADYYEHVFGKPSEILGSDRDVTYLARQAQ